MGNVVLFVPSFRLVRPADHVVLDVSLTGFTQTHVDTPQGRRYLITVPAGGTGRIWVQFPSQQILEYATPAANPNPDQPSPERATQNQPIYGPRTDVVVDVPAGTTIDFSAAGLLAALAQQPLRITPNDPQLPVARTVPRARSSAYALLAASAKARTATEARTATKADDLRSALSALIGERIAEHEARLTGGTVVDPLPQSAEPAPSNNSESDRPAEAATAAQLGPVGPFPTATRFSLPRRLAIRPPGGPGPRLTHASDPVDHGGRTELWTTRYAIRTDDPTEPPVESDVQVRLDAHDPHPSPPAPISDALLVNSLTDGDNKTFADLSKIKTVTMSDLSLSSLGGWVTLDGTWPNGTLPPTRLRHETRQGRDQFQYKVLIGRLVPFGNLAVLTSTTNRSFESGTKRAAALQTIASIDILEPNVPFAPTRAQTVGNQTFTRGEPWPWSSIAVAEPPDGVQQPIAGTNLSKFLVGGADWRFEVTAVDRMGNTTILRLPMLFAAAPPPPADANAPLTASARTTWLQLYASAGLDLAGQPIALTAVPEPPPPDSGGRAGGPLPPVATTVLAKQLTMSFTPDGRPQVDSLRARLPSIDAVTGQIVDELPGGLGEVSLAYAKPYLDSVYAEANRQGQVFLQVLESEGQAAVLSLGKQAAGGLAGVDLPIAALSASQGTVAGVVGAVDDAAALASLATLATGKVDFNFVTDKIGTLLGLVPLNEILDTGADLTLKDAQHVVQDSLDGVLTKTVTWKVPLFRRNAQGQVIPFRKGFIELKPVSANPRITIIQTLVADAGTSEVHGTTSCEIKDLELRVFYRSDPPPTDEPLVVVPFSTISATFRDTEKPEIDVKFAAVRFGGLLKYIGVLAELIDDLGLSDPPALEITPDGALSSFSFQVPAVAVGMFALENITFATSLQLNFTKQPAVLLIVAFSSFDHPFRMTVAFLGGGGYIRVGAASDGLALIEGSLSFGASISVNLGVASGSVEAMGGICFRYDRAVPLAEIVAFLRVRGELNVLGLISVSVTLLITLTYDLDSNSLIGHAEYVVQVSVLFFSQSVVVPFTWVIAGKNSDPTFAELMAPDEL